ncbi:hypothetical protein AK95_00805 [Paenibacillus sp. LC231]|nr:hypothetical protein AK95_00805 [Paenibacillus sp. LC231]
MIKTTIIFIVLVIINRILTSRKYNLEIKLMILRAFSFKYLLIIKYMQRDKKVPMNESGESGQLKNVS